MNKWIAEFDLEDGDTMPEHMDLEYKGARIDFHCRPLEQGPINKIDCKHTDCNNCVNHKYCDYESTAKNDSGVEECISKQAALDACHNFAIGILDDYYEKCLKQWIIDLPPATPQESTDKCRWIKYDHRTMCPKKHIDVDSPYWRIPENRMETLKYCPYCGKEIEVEK